MARPSVWSGTSATAPGFPRGLPSKSEPAQPGPSRRAGLKPGCSPPGEPAALHHRQPLELAGLDPQGSSRRKPRSAPPPRNPALQFSPPHSPPPPLTLPEGRLRPLPAPAHAVATARATLRASSLAAARRAVRPRHGVLPGGRGKSAGRRVEQPDLQPGGAPGSLSEATAAAAAEAAEAGDGDRRRAGSGAAQAGAAAAAPPAIFRCHFSPPPGRGVLGRRRGGRGASKGGGAALSSSCQPRCAGPSRQAGRVSAPSGGGDRRRSDPASGSPRSPSGPRRFPPSPRSVSEQVQKAVRGRGRGKAEEGAGGGSLASPSPGLRRGGRLLTLAVVFPELCEPRRVSSPGLLDFANCWFFFWFQEGSSLCSRPPGSLRYLVKKKKIHFSLVWLFPDV